MDEYAVRHGTFATDRVLLLEWQDNEISTLPAMVPMDIQVSDSETPSLAALNLLVWLSLL